MDQSPPSRHAVTFVLLSVLLDMVGFGLIIPVLPGLIEDVGGIGLSDAAKIGGWMFFAFSLAQFACSPLMGNLSDRFGRRPLLLLAIAGLGLDYLLQAFAPNLLWLFVGRIIAGVCRWPRDWRPARQFWPPGAVLCGGGDFGAESDLWLYRAARDFGACQSAGVFVAALEPSGGLCGVSWL
jgi:MFS family permease